MQFLLLCDGTFVNVADIRTIAFGVEVEKPEMVIDFTITFNDGEELVAPEYFSSVTEGAEEVKRILTCINNGDTVIEVSSRCGSIFQREAMQDGNS